MPSFERRTWPADPSAPAGRAARRAFAYDAFVPDDLASFNPSLPATTSALLGEAERAVAELNQAPARLEGLRVLAHRLLRSEAVASSWLEGYRLSHRRLARAEASPVDRLDATAATVLANVEAMQAGVALVDDGRAASLDDIVRVHRLLMERHDPAMAGKLRDEQNWIGGFGESPAGADFVPPPPEYVRPLMNDLVGFISRADVSPVLQAAVAHAQFETIYPFADGNGRTGRALIHMILRSRELAPVFIPPVSLVLARNADAYRRGLTSFQRGDLSAWAEDFSRALRIAADRSVVLAGEVAALQAEWTNRAGKPRAGSAAAGILKLLPAVPVLTVATAATLTKRSAQAANLAMARLASAGVVRETSLGPRNRVFEASGLLDLVARFEASLSLQA